MSTILTLKQIAVAEQDDKMKHRIKILEKYLDSHSKNIKVFIQDDGVLVYSNDVFLLKI